MKTNLIGRATFLCVVVLAMINQVGCHSAPHRDCGLSCDSLPCDVAQCESAPCEATDCDAMPCDCDGGCDLCCDDPCGDACDANPGLFSRQLVRGRPIKLLDDIGSVIGFANKIALWDLRADCHRITPQTEREVLTYLRRNGLTTTLVRSNQYDPIGEWERLVANKRMAAPWKYTFGTYDWLKYTLIPGRVLGGDWYNPFTDTVHLYSDIPSIALAKAAYAKDVHSRTLPGTYAAGQDTPILGLWHESLANTEVLRYLEKNGTDTDVVQARQVLYPDFGGALGAQVLGFLPYGSVYGRAAGAVGGHAYRELTQPESVRSASSLSNLFR